MASGSTMVSDPTSGVLKGAHTITCNLEQFMHQCDATGSEVLVRVQPAETQSGNAKPMEQNVSKANQTGEKLQHSKTMHLLAVDK